MHHPIAIFGEAVTQLLPKMRDFNPDIDEATLVELAEVFLSNLCQQLLRARNQLARSLDDNDKIMLLVLFTEHGIKRETAENLYRELITLNLEEPDSDETPLQ